MSSSRARSPVAQCLRLTKAPSSPHRRLAVHILVFVAESAEHQFLSQCVTGVLSQLSRTNLYAYVEAERRKFDFACELLRDWSRPLVGQTLWSHTAGVDKDLRTMLLDPDAEICAYVARDTVKARRLLSEVMKDFRSSGFLVAPHRLRVLWVPQDFDADDEAQRELITELLRESVGRDILMNIVLGNLTAEDVRFFVRTSGLAGLHLALLYVISTTPEPSFGNTALANQGSRDSVRRFARGGPRTCAASPRMWLPNPVRWWRDSD